MRMFVMLLVVVMLALSVAPVSKAGTGDAAGGRPTNPNQR